MNAADQPGAGGAKDAPAGAPPPPPPPPLLVVRDLVKHYAASRGLFSAGRDRVRAVDGVSFDIRAGETLALVGESGSGKTTTGRCVLRLVEPTSGRVTFDGIDLLALRPGPLRRMRRHFQVIFQDPYGSLNPRMRVGTIVREPLDIHRVGSRAEREAATFALLERVGLDRDAARRYPHEFSGGQRQRIGVARALALRPRLIIADEPVSALDVSVQAQVVNLLMDLQEERGIAYLFIAHDLAVVERIADRVAVMHLGRIVEMGGKEDVFTNPLHPYTRALLQAIPVPDPDGKRARTPLKGEMPSPARPPRGCRFHTRCPVAFEPCATVDTPLVEAAPGHYVACHLVPALAAGPAGTVGTSAAARA